MPTIEVQGKEVVDFRGLLPVRKGVESYPNRPLEGITMVVIHYSGVDADSGALQIAEYQTGKREGDLFPECAYSFVVRWRGRIEQCHDLERRTWHAGGGNNDAGIGVCLPGSDWPTPEQIDSTAALVRALQRDMGRELRVVGHRELRPTLCPGPHWELWKGDLLQLSRSPHPPVPVVLGFRRLYNYLGSERCGVPLSPERHDGHGNSTQLFSRCEMRWDRAENRVWVSFTECGVLSAGC